MSTTSPHRLSTASSTSAIMFAMNLTRQREREAAERNQAKAVRDAMDRKLQREKEKEAKKEAAAAAAAAGGKDQVNMVDESKKGQGGAKKKTSNASSKDAPTKGSK